MFYINILSDGKFEIIDGEWQALYPHLNFDTLPSLTDEQYQQWCEQGNEHTRFENGEFIFRRPEISLDAAKANKLAQLNAQAQAYINRKAGIDTLPDFEVQTWSIQAAEARAWAVDKSADTPVLNEIAAARGIAPDLLKQAALRKTIAYETLTARVVGVRQAVQTWIEQAKSVDELAAIEFEFGETQLETQKSAEKSADKDKV